MKKLKWKVQDAFKYYDFSLDMLRKDQIIVNILTAECKVGMRL